MADSMTQRVAHILLAGLRHDVSAGAISLEEAAVEMTRQVFTAMREPSETMISEGKEALDGAAGPPSPSARVWTAMMDTALAEEFEEKPPQGPKAW